MKIYYRKIEEEKREVTQNNNIFGYRMRDERSVAH